MSISLLPGYTSKFGNKNVAAADVTGPSYYFTGGWEIPASDLGWGGFDFAIAGDSVSGTYAAVARFTTGRDAQQFVKIEVRNASTNTEVAYGVDLSAETFRMFFIGV